MVLGVLVWLLFLAAPIVICVLARHEARTDPNAEGVRKQDAHRVAWLESERALDEIRARLQKQEEERIQEDDQQYYDWLRSGSG